MSQEGTLSPNPDTRKNGGVMRDLRRRQRSALILASLAAAFTGACSSELTQPLPGQMGQPGQPVPSTLEAITSTSHTATVGSPVTPTPAVRVKDQNGNP